MRRRYLWLVLIGSLVAITLFVLLCGGLRRASAQNSGLGVSFIVPAGTPITASGDVIIYIGQPSGSTQAVGCAVDANQYPVQTTVITDPGGGRTTRVSDLITLSQTSPVANGTRAGSLAVAGQCVANGANWDKYNGTVQ